MFHLFVPEPFGPEPPKLKWKAAYPNPAPQLVIWLGGTYAAIARPMIDRKHVADDLIVAESSDGDPFIENRVRVRQKL